MKIINQKEAKMGQLGAATTRCAAFLLQRNIANKITDTCISITLVIIIMEDQYFQFKVTKKTGSCMGDPHWG